MNRSVVKDDRGLSSLDCLYKRLRRERLCQVGYTSRFNRRQVVHLAVIAGNIDDRRRDAIARKRPSQLDTGLAVQIDIDDDADRLIETVVIEQRLRRTKQRGVEAVLPQEPLDAQAH